MKLSELIEETRQRLGLYDLELKGVTDLITARLYECVKPLVWMQNGDHYASGHGYVIRKISGKFTLTVRNKYDRKFHTLEAAKAAAQAHYAGQIVEGLNL